MPTFSQSIINLYNKYLFRHRRMIGLSVFSKLALGEVWGSSSEQATPIGARVIHRVSDFDRRQKNRGPPFELPEGVRRTPSAVRNAPKQSRRIYN